MNKVKVINSTTPVLERRFADNRMGRPRQLIVKGTGSVLVKSSSDDITYTQFQTLENGGYNATWDRLLIEIECTGDSTVEVGG